MLGGIFLWRDFARGIFLRRDFWLEGFITPAEKYPTYKLIHLKFGPFHLNPEHVISSFVWQNFLKKKPNKFLPKHTIFNSHPSLLLNLRKISQYPTYKLIHEELIHSHTCTVIIVF